MVKKMVTLTIDDHRVFVPEGTTILDAALTVNVRIPTLCYLKGINEIGACRVCIVEVEGVDRLVASCNNVVAEGMVVRTNSPRVRRARRKNVELIMSQHDCRCATCARSGNCSLQTLSNDLNLLDVPYKYEARHTPWDKNSPLIRDSSKCIKCMRCIQVCEKVQSIGIWDVAGTGSRATVDVSYNRTITDSECTFCGQCIANCPTGALRERDDTQRVVDALDDPNVITVIQVAPAVRASWAEQIGLSPKDTTTEKMVCALRRMGFDYIFDTNFAADLTIMEEASEFVERFTHADEYPWPMFTSCCPGWVRFVKSQYPDMVANLSTAKSPHEMFGAVTKTYFAEKIGVDPEKLFVISLMPCVAKKSEAELPTMNDGCGKPDVDVVLTTRELTRLFRSDHLAAQDLSDENFDHPMGSGTGAAVIFGTTGGVMEAALRTGNYLITGANPQPDAFSSYKAVDGGWREAEFEIPGAGVVKVAVASGLANTRRLIEAIRAGEVSYHFVEIMACPGGCSGGGGQPIFEGRNYTDYRSRILRRIDRDSDIRFSHENSDVQALYSEYLDKPLSELSHHLLHTDHFAWDMPKAAPREF
jgi:NADH-quinone oxidoreductase subunit G